MPLLKVTTERGENESNSELWGRLKMLFTEEEAKISKKGSVEFPNDFATQEVDGVVTAEKKYKVFK